MITQPVTLDTFVGIAAAPLPEDILTEKYQPMATGLSFEGARDYCLQNLKTHPREKLWFYLVPVAGTYRVVREVA